MLVNVLLSLSFELAYRTYFIVRGQNGSSGHISQINHKQFFIMSQTDLKNEMLLGSTPSAHIFQKLMTTKMATNLFRHAILK